MNFRHPLLCLIASIATASAGVRDDALASTSKVVVQQAADFVETSQALATAVEAWSLDGDPEKLTAAREAWLAARLSWKRCEIIRLGPSVTLRTHARVDFFPIAGALISRSLASPMELTETFFEERLGSSQKGFGALEYLLFPDPPNESTPAQDPDRARTLARLIAHDIAKHAKENHTAWQAFAPELATMGDHGISELVTLLSIQVDILLNSPFVAWIELSNGNRTNQFNGLRSGHLAAEIDAAVAGVQAVLMGGDGIGLDDATAAVGSKAAVNLNATLTQLRASVGRIGSLPEGDRTAAITAAREECRTALRQVRTELLSALGATLFFTNQDGD